VLMHEGTPELRRGDWTSDSLDVTVGSRSRRQRGRRHCQA
jgi:hypothetical protein